MTIVDDTTEAGAPGRSEPLRCLVETTRALDDSQHIESALDAVAARVVASTPAELVLVAVMGDDGELRPVSFRYADPALADRTDVLHQLCRPVPDGMVESALLGVPVLVEDVPAHADCLDLDVATRACLTELGVVSAAAYPLRVRGQVLGVLMAGTTSAAARLTVADGDLLGEVASRAGQALASDRLFQTLQAAEDRFVAAFEYAPIGMALLVRGEDGPPRFVDVNPALCVILGRPADALVGAPVTAFMHADDAAGPGACTAGERRFVRPDGEVRRCCAQSASLNGSGYLVYQLVDVSDHRRDQDELAHVSAHDRLTGLLNRPGYERALGKAVEAARCHGEEGAVVILDLDNFKVLNDTYGVEAGDALLQLVARTLACRLRGSDVVARVGDDEFGVILTATAGAPALEVAGQLVECVRSIAMPRGPHVVRPTVSAGVRTFGPDHVRPAAELIADADAAVLDAKDDGRDRLAVATPDGDFGPKRAHRRWSERIRVALDEDRFVLHEQPILAVASRRVVRSELLVRMLDEEGGLVAPGAFLPAAERFGQIQAIDRWVVAHALDLIRSRAAAGVRCPVNVNLSGESLSDDEMIDDLVDHIRAAGVNGRDLTFEVTETAAVLDIDRARDAVGRLASLGCGVALDDFGTGFSSFAYLKHLPVDAVKIDGQFVRDLAIDNVDRLTVQAIVDVSRAAGATTTAEYVSDGTTLALLEHLGVDYAQGFHIGRPRPALTRPDWLLP